MLKTPLIFKNATNSELDKENQGLAYSNALIGDLVNKDTDLDGVLDWEESLWGTDPTKKETAPGISDSVAIDKLKAEQGIGEKIGGDSQNTENLTETDKFSRELFSTVATLNQEGEMDQATIDKISSSLADHIQNSPPRKIYTFSDIKVIKDDSVQAVKKYNDTLDSIHAKYPIKGNVADILQKFIADENNVNTSALAELDPIIEPTNKIINATVKTSVPQFLAPLHLDFINGLERFTENLNDIKLYDTDVIVSFSAMSQYEQNTAILEVAAKELRDAIRQKLNN
ncbi:MAG: hypothetical protein UU82_C0008G0007 [Candidatus Nomurabacteria bacterium GW2011_GWC2_41_8]|uniref:Uncharacterized protein n=3 Tax=Candidatus Nomuraibacteriota TaxID=1752729 RepID=A0A1F6YDE0_9BACT|nr:MAG: hypothetical protein UU58_C0005G0013 [Candidatus Nomurabacteria bacterium GW2011_GWA2_41_25]KKS24286.1 MAG: hypothetical protein UU82_C0008G0007 [Candidatus Nomurabacteria bacterium GW2011_GWC2_41_8]OGI66864.1 MAG: hypothetical protein A2823_03140 [Candidatus Nomurabacteria bacterium RIFCSPHIGHO2_01_FULL_41_91]OGI80582.1 MAG: hypothetical protein A3D43_02080 [Candidatus Nomurabacteria bacterium RIFCSPHIGHO2_02_FULL_41_52]OGI84444.1 MAG: hypothetical protein A3F49_03275 [Candidatus Nomur